MQVVITMAGRGRRFSEKGFHEPKPMVTVANRPVFSYLIDTYPSAWSLIFVLAEHDRSSQLESLIYEYSLKSRPREKVQVIYTPFSDRGPIDTVQAALPFLKTNEGVLVSYCDLAPVWNPQAFEQAILTFDMASVNYQGFHPTYKGPNSYCHVRVDQNHHVIQLQEKVFFTEEIEKEVTSAGIYYFKNKYLLAAALQQQAQQNLKYKNEFYVSFALQALLNQNFNYKILDFRIWRFIQFGTPADTERFEFWLQYLKTGKLDYQFQFIEPSHVPSRELASEFEKEKKYWQSVFKSFNVQ